MTILQQILYADQVYPVLTAGYIAILGLFIGSFLNVCIYRIPSGKSVAWPGSHCSCGKSIRWHDNIPVLGWLILRGKARCCGVKFSARYPLIEALTGVLFVLIWISVPVLHFPTAAILVCCLIAGAVIDLDTTYLPDRFTMGLVVLGFASAIIHPAVLLGVDAYVVKHPVALALQKSVLGLAVGTAIGAWIAFVGEKCMGKEAFGMGDVKLLGGIGAVLGWEAATFSMFGGAMVGLVILSLIAAYRRARGNPANLQGVEIPFGPYISIAAVLYILGGNDRFLNYLEMYRPLFS